jgi:hypothetical protein
MKLSTQYVPQNYAMLSVDMLQCVIVSEGALLWAFIGLLAN